MTKNPNQYSNSKIATYKTCKLKYKFQYLSDEESTFDTVEAFMGLRVHDALEKLYLDLKMTKLVTLDELLGFYNGIWEKHWNENIHIVKEEYTKDDYKRKGEKCLMDYYNRHQPFDQDKTIALERNFRFKINDKYTILGIIDRLAEMKDGTFVIHDYKTSNKLPTQEEIDTDRQLALYQLGIKSLWPNVKGIKLVYHYLTFDKELSPLQNKSLEEEEKFKRGIVDSIKEIESTEEYSPTPSSLCMWCDYQPYCPKRKHLFKVEALPEKLYHEDNGVKLVDKYVEVWSERQRIELSLEEIKKAILQYAKAEGIEAIKGSNYKIYAKTGNRKSFPSKDDIGRQGLEELLKTSGRWNEVSILWLSFLEQRLKTNEWNQGLIDQVRSFQLEKESKWVSRPYKLNFA